MSRAYFAVSKLDGLLSLCSLTSDSNVSLSFCLEKKVSIFLLFFASDNLCFLAPLAVGQRAYVMVRCASVRALTFSLNIFFAETTYQILMKFHSNVPTMVLFRIS